MKGEAVKVSESKYSDMVARVREIHMQHGCKLYHDPDEYGINQHLSSQNGEIVFVFYHDSLSRIRVSEGEITPLGSHVMGTVSYILEILKDEFGLEHIETIDGLIGERWHHYKATKGLPV